MLTSRQKIRNWFIVVSLVTKEAKIAAVGASSLVGSASPNRRHSLRTNMWAHEDGKISGQQQPERSLQAYTNMTAQYEDGPAVNQDREVDFEYCYGALQRADSNNDGRLETADYLSFVQDYGSNAECLGNIMSLPVMPIELTACWNQLSCECRNRGGAPDCCEKENAHLPLNGVNAVDPAPSGQTTQQPPKEEYIQTEQDFLRQACVRTDQCIISFCGYPPPPLPIPPPVPPTPPPTIPPVPVEKNLEVETNYLWLLFLLLLLCCCRRRWILCPVAKDDDEENQERAPDDPAAMGSLPADIENRPDGFEGDYNDPDANKMSMKSTAATEVGEGGGIRYYRVVQEPEYEEPPPPPEPKILDQYDKGVPEGDGMKLKHIEKDGPPPPEDDPYALEHYEPDGGVVEHKRKGKWSFLAGGGYNKEERAKKEKSDWKRPGYNRAAKKEEDDPDNRRDRNLNKYEGGAIFDHLDETDEPAKRGAGNSLEWVFSNTLNTLENNEDDLRSNPSSSSQRS